MALIEIFKAGEHKSASGKTFNVTKDDLQIVVDNYKAEFHEAPIVVGHPKMDAPAYGWIEHLELDGDVLKAQPKEVDAEFAELVRSGKFKKISAAFYLPQSESNPKPEGYYLRHVGFLGAFPPAVKGLKDPIFHDSTDDVVEFGEFSEWTNASLWSRMRDFFIEKFGLEDTDKVLPAWQIQDLHNEVIRDDLKRAAEVTENTPHLPIFTEPTDDNPQGETMSPEDQQKMADLEAENARLKAEQAQAKKEAEAKENAEFAEGLVAEGKLLPKQKEAALALLNTDFGSAEFGEDDFKGNLKTFLSELPKSIEFGEAATKEKATTADDDSVQYAEGTSAEAIETDQAVRAYMKEHNVGYVAAFNAIHS